jgi:hypothetical protein
MARTPDEIFNRIERLIAEGADVDPFVNEIHELVTVMRLASGSIVEPGQRLYRATKHHKAVPGHTTEISYPPAACIGCLGRCNRAGLSVFYCSSDQNCVLEEISPEVGNLVVRATWQVSERTLLQDIGYTDAVLERAGATRSLPERYGEFAGRLTDDGRRIRDYIASAFTNRSSKYYALTAAIAEVHLRSDQIVGIMYPSITRSANCDNLALQPSFVGRGLRLVAAEALRVRVWNETSPDAYGIADLADVTPDGTLVWKYTGAEKTQIGGSEATAMLIEPGKPVTCDSDGEVMLNGVRYVLRRGFTIQLEGDTVTVRDTDGTLVPPDAAMTSS